MVKSAVTLKSDKKRKAPKTAWAKGVSGNPKGGPKRGESWAEIIKKYGDMTPIEAADAVMAVAKQLKPFGDTITLKEAVVVRIYAALLFEPNASLFTAFMDRADGKVTNPIDVTSGGMSWKEFVENANRSANSNESE